MLIEQELAVYQMLRKQCEKICLPNQLSQRLFYSVLQMCDPMAVVAQLINLNIDPKDGALTIKSLISKGFVKQFTVKGGPSFLPRDYWKITDVKYLEMPTGKDYNS